MGDFGGIFGSDKQKTESSSTTSQKTSPWETAMPALTKGVRMAGDFMSDPMEFYPGQTYLPYNPGQMEALGGLRDSASANYGIADQALAGWSGMMTGQGMDGQLWDDQLRYYGQRSQDALERFVIPGINDEFTSTGGRMSSRAGIAEGLARAETGRDILGYNNQLALDFENLKSGDRRFALGSAGEMINNMMMPGNQMFEAETALRGDQQRALEEEMMRFYHGQTAPRDALTSMMPYIMDPAYRFGETTGNSESESTVSQNRNPWQILTGAAMAGAGMMTDGGMPATPATAGMSGMGSMYSGGGIGLSALPYMMPNRYIQPQFASGVQ